MLTCIGVMYLDTKGHMAPYHKAVESILNIENNNVSF